MKIVMVMSDWAMYKPIDPTNIWNSPRGLTGSEISFFKYASCLKALGHDVICRANVTHDGTIDNVPCYSNVFGKFDVAIAWIDPRPLVNINAKKKVLNQQVNDFHYCQGWQEYIDVVTSPSNSHRDYLKTFNEFHGRWEVLPNGVDVSIFSLKNTGIRPHSLVYASSPDRGLHWLLEAFPKIKKRVPDVTLDVFYDWRNFYENVKDGNTETSYRLRYCKEMFDRLKTKGVTHHGSISRQKMAQVFSENRILSYPCDTVSYTEGFSVTTLEAAMAGCVPVIVGTDALDEVYGNYLDVIPAPYSNNKEKYVDLVVRMLTDDLYYRESQKRAQELGQLYNWEILSKILHKIII